MSNPIVGTPPTPVFSSTGTVAITITVANALDTVLICLTSQNASAIALNSIVDSVGSITTISALTYVSESDELSLGWYMITGAAAGSHTITATFASAIHATIAAAELSVVSPTVDVVSTINHGDSVSPSTTSMNTANSGDFVFAAIMQLNATYTLASWTNSFTQINYYNVNDPSLGWAWFNQTSPGAISTGATLGVSVHWAAQAVALTPAATTSPLESSGSAIRMSGTAVRIGMAPLMMMPLGWIIERRRRLARKPEPEFVRDEKTGLMLPRDPK